MLRHYATRAVPNMWMTHTHKQGSSMEETVWHKAHSFRCLCVYCVVSRHRWVTVQRPWHIKTSWMAKKRDHISSTKKLVVGFFSYPNHSHPPRVLLLMVIGSSPFFNIFIPDVFPIPISLLCVYTRECVCVCLHWKARERRRKNLGACHMFVSVIVL